MALLCVCTTLKGQFGLVEEVAVDGAARGSHVGVHLMVALLEHAGALELDFVELTSRPSRYETGGTSADLSRRSAPVAGGRPGDVAEARARARSRMSSCGVATELLRSTRWLPRSVMSATSWCPSS